MKIAKLLAAATSLLMALGCSSTVDPGSDGAGTYIWKNRELRGTFAGPLLDVADAAERGFEELRLVGVNRVVDGLKGRIGARMAEGTKVTVRLKAIDFGNTRFVIKIGTFGDKAMSQQVARYVVRELRPKG